MKKYKSLNFYFWENTFKQRFKIIEDEFRVKKLFSLEYKEKKIVYFF